jgi:hypothetical protein
MAHPKQHHYVPAFVLRNFESGNKRQLFGYDKHTDKVFRTKAANIAREKHFYDFEFDGEKFSLEEGLQEIEDSAAPYIQRIIQDKKLNIFDPLERGYIARFLAVQMVRTPALHITFEDVFQRMKIHLRNDGAPDEFFNIEPELGDKENALRVIMAQNIYNAPQEYSHLFLNKNWLLFQCSSHNPFLIGDHPLVMHNTLHRAGRGNLGIAVDGIEIYMPLSPTLTLALLCPNYYREFRQCYNPIYLEEKNVEFQNSLQIFHSERFLFSATNSFTLAKEMISANVSFRNGKRLESNFD